MCIMGNDNDPPTHIPSWKFPDERHKITKLIKYSGLKKRNKELD